MRVQYVGQPADIHCVHAFGGQSFQQVTTQRFLSVVTATGSLAVQPPDAVATVSAFPWLGLQPGDFSRRLAESLWYASRR
jgi:hypothetical protein